MIKGPVLPYPEEHPLAMVRAQQKTTPKAVAVVRGSSTSLAYRDLDTSSLQALVRSIDPKMTARHELYNPASIDDPLYLTRSSGSTGPSKAVLRTGRNVVSRLAWEVHEGNQLIMPLNSGLPHLLVALIQGKTCYMLEPGTLDEMTSGILAAPVSEMTILPQFIGAILGRKAKLAGVKTVTSLGAPLSDELASQFRAAYPAITLRNGYGSTEAGYVMFDGQPVANAVVSIRNGLLTASGPGVAYGYGYERLRFVGLFHSKDKAREANGKIELLGRA